MKMDDEPKKKTPIVYGINRSQMRFLWFIQLLSLLILIGFFFLPIMIFYYLGWAPYHQKQNESFFDFLFSRLPSGSDTPTQTSSLTNKINLFLFSLLKFIFLMTILLFIGLLFLVIAESQGFIHQKIKIFVYSIKLTILSCEQVLLQQQASLILKPTQ